MKFDIPYIKLRFDAEIQKDTVMPTYKVSALRGGMGTMLLRQNCISDGKCEKCRFQKACVVCHTLYSRMEDAPEYVTGRESVGYLIECADFSRDYAKGDTFSFYLILFGDSIVFFNIYLQAFCQLGMSGLGKDRSTFRIKRVTDDRGNTIINGNTVDMSRYRIRNVSEYVQERKRKLLNEAGSWRIRFVTPLCM